MPILQNQRQELFANLLARGKMQSKAYAEAGYKPNSKSAKKLAQHPDVKRRIAELNELAVAETTLTVQKVLDELMKLGFSNMLDYIKIDEDGSAELDFKGLTREQAAAIGEITTEETTNPRTGEITKRTKFKLLDKKGALVDLGRHLQMWVDRKDIRVGGIMFHVTKEDMQL